MKTFTNDEEMYREALARGWEMTPEEWAATHPASKRKITWKSEDWDSDGAKLMLAIAYGSIGKAICPDNWGIDAPHERLRRLRRALPAYVGVTPDHEKLFDPARLAEALGLPEATVLDCLVSIEFETGLRWIYRP